MFLKRGFKAAQMTSLKLHRIDFFPFEWAAAVLDFAQRYLPFLLRIDNLLLNAYLLPICTQVNLAFKVSILIRLRKIDFDMSKMNASLKEIP